MSLDPEAVARIAHLARIKMPESDLAPMAEDLNRILGFVEQLSALDTDAVEPMTAVVPHALRRRVDAVTDGKVREKVLANAPETAEGFYVVPKVVE